MSRHVTDFAWHTAIPVESEKRHAVVRRSFNRWLLDIDNPLVDSGEEILHVKIRKGRASRTVHLSVEYDNYGTASVCLRDGGTEARLPIDMRAELRPPEEHRVCGVIVNTYEFQEIWNKAEHVSEVIEMLGIEEDPSAKTPANKRLAYLAHKLRGSGLEIKKFKRGRKLYQKDKFKRKRKGSAEV
tara:strand:- start:111 stop:665 length:555 start_codon:yes stop_codon:yes gene_type:complete